VLVLVLGLVSSAWAQLPLGWRNADVGAPSPPGSASYHGATDTWTVTGDGLDIIWYEDHFHYVYKRIRGDGEITARVVSLTGTNLHEWAKAGIMIRESLESGSKFCYVMISGDNGCRCQERTATNAAVFSDTLVATNEQKAIHAPYWIRLVRQGNEFRAYYSSNPATDPWHELVWSPRTVEMSENVYIGLAVTSHQEGVLCTAECDNVVVEGETVTSAGFTYQGRLLDNNVAADGLYDAEFTLFDVPEAGTQLRNTIAVHDIDVIDGYFTVPLDFGNEIFNGDDRWLEIRFRPGNSTGSFTTLSPRQKFTPTPYAIYAETAGSGGGGADNDWRVSGNNMYAIPSGNVGIGTMSPSRALHIQNSRGSIRIDRDENCPSVYMVRTAPDDFGNVWKSFGIGTSAGGQGSGHFFIADLGTATGGGGTERFHIDSFGNIGIGTMTPEAKLDVDGQVKITGGSPGAGKVLTSDAVGLATWQEPTGGGGPDGDWAVSGNNMYSMPSGNVGVGTSSPTTKLDVNGQMRIRGGSPGDGKVLTSDSTGTASWRQPTGGGGPDNDWTVSGNNMYATPSGNVGVGTSSPSAKLEVNGQVRIVGGSPGAGKVLTSDASGLASWQESTGGGGPDSDWAVSGNNMYTMPSGNIGVGTSSPTTKLDVNGQMRVRGGSPGAGKVLTSDASGLASWQEPTGGGGPDSDWAISGSDMYARPSGNVGIGTMNPGSKLEVTGSSSRAIFQGTNTGGGVGIQGESSSNHGVVGKSTMDEGVHGESTNGYGVYGANTSTGNSGHVGGPSYGVYGSGSSTGVLGESNDGYGVHGKSTSSQGVYGKSDNGVGVFGASNYDVAVYGQSDNATGILGTGAGSNNAGIYGINPGGYGVFGNSTDGTGVYGISTSRYGVHGESFNSYGVYGKSDSTTGIFGEGSGSGKAGVYGVNNSGDGRGVHGSSSGIGVFGEGGQHDFYAPHGTYDSGSSIRWKRDIQPIDDPLDKVLALRGVYFDWDQEHGGEHAIGMIAEEVGQVLPEIVSYEENAVDATGMDYSKLTPLLVEAIKELKSENDSLKERLEALESIISQNQAATRTEVQNEIR
jgi:hypothetical protein